MISESIRERFHVGQRMVKTVLAVFTCFVIDHFRGGGNPFHSAIAAIVSMQRSVEDSWATGRQRLIATIIGGIYGILVIIFEVNVYIIPNALLRYAMLSLLLIPLIKLTVTLKQSQGVTLTTIVFLAITIANPVETGMTAAFDYARNRIIDTLLGVLIALAINAIPLDFWRFFRREKDKSRLPSDETNDS